MRNQQSLQGRWTAILVVCCSLFHLGLQSQGAGRIVVANDDWTLSDFGFMVAPDTGIFATNVAAWFTGGRPGRFLAYSDHFGLTESSLSNAMAAAGHTWIVNAISPFDVATLQGYNGVFVGKTTPIDTSVLVDYVNAGGHVYLVGSCTAEDPVRLNPFLEAFGLRLEQVVTPTGVMPIDSTHPLFAGVHGLYQWGGFNIVDLTPSDPASQILVSFGGQGLYAIWAGTNEGCGQLAIDLYAGISVQGRVGAPYQIEYASSVDETNWATLTDLVLPQSPHFIFDPDSPRRAMRFYRVKCGTNQFFPTPVGMQLVYTASNSLGSTGTLQLTSIGLVTPTYGREYSVVRGVDSRECGFQPLFVRSTLDEFYVIPWDISQTEGLEARNGPVGTTWTNQWCDGSSDQLTIAANESVTVPAGTYDCLKTEEREINNRLRLRYVHWDKPGFGRVKWIDYSDGTKPVEVYELLSREFRPPQ